MIKSTITKRKYRAIYRLLNMVSPLDEDCGKLCGACCCTSVKEGSEMGIYLLPDKVQNREDPWLTWTVEDPEDYEFPTSWKGKMFFVNCNGPEKCKRESRPLQCRTFPLAPHITSDGELLMLYNDVDLPYRCPLIDEEIPLNDDFVKATTTVWKHLLKDPLIYDLVKQDSEDRERAVIGGVIPLGQAGYILKVSGRSRPFRDRPSSDW